MDGLKTGFIPRIEALRGVAALAVGICHSFLWLSIAGQRSIWNTPIQDVAGIQGTASRAIAGLFGGGAAVDLFFVLSGFVLSRSLIKADASAGAYVSFMVRRVFRIYPALFASLGLAAAYLAFVYGGYRTFPTMSEWGSWFYVQPLTWHLALSNMALTEFGLNGATWTMRIEMLASLVFPLIFFLCRSGGRLACAVIFAGSLLLMTLDGPQHYLYMFVLGILVHAYGDTVVSRLPGRSIGFVALAAVLLLIGPEFFTLNHSFLTDLLMSTGAATLVAITAHRPDFGGLSLLDWRITRFLGRVSYSFYLVHTMALFSVMRVMFERMPDFFLTRLPLLVMASSALISIAAGLCLAWAMYLWVEKPFGAIGHRFAGHFRAGAVSVGAAIGER